MKTYKRETPRHAIVRSAAMALAKDYPNSTEQNYRQNCWQYIEPSLIGFIFRARYFTHLSALGKTRLYNDIARRAVIENKLNQPSKQGVVYSYDQYVYTDEETARIKDTLKWIRFWGGSQD